MFPIGVPGNPEVLTCAYTAMSGTEAPKRFNFNPPLLSILLLEDPALHYFTHSLDLISGKSLLTS